MAAAAVARARGRGAEGWPHPVQAGVAAGIAADRVAPLLAGVVKDQLASGGLHLAHLVGHGAERLPSPVGHTVAPAQEIQHGVQQPQDDPEQSRADRVQR